MGIYEYSETQNKHKTYDLLKDLSEHSQLPWLVGGDFNRFFFNFENKGRPNKHQALLDNFRDAFSNCNLHDMGFWGYEFMWWNKRDSDQSVEECLDGFCATID